MSQEAKREIAEVLSQLRVATDSFIKHRNGLAAELNAWLKADGYEPRKDEAPGPLCVAGELIPAKVDYYSVRRRAALTGLELSSVNVCEKHAHVYPLTTLGA